ncbi:leucine-rich repeat, immunoglobulin-like domain and transmembrane domain-containing protein 3 [Tachyglossus aculeatus]|uniref:leucine-rich repeat, immunoglobulin-like domain and transmembrane domain-containing protein 3 n=1 Tax=Tachyglossus aculeatus TaxID=9261 RepID=UPI0018F542A6|nr:leucine-rich repeat, immunoglobulin-like domain and transmembrane domain-containing protein 3 [Tachyglossus aculeatus]
MLLFPYLCITLGFIDTANSFCPTECTCVAHGTWARSVLCNDPDMDEIPTNVPVETVKLRIEKTAIRRLPTEAFYYLVDLKYLWIAYSSVTNIDIGSFYNLKQLHELRLDGNLLAAFPWESLLEMPNLRTLDLRNNKLVSLPPEASRFLKNLTYLDISSNKLTTLPPDLLDVWPPFSKPESGRIQVLPPPRIVLGLQDNPWFCDCRLSKVIELSKTVDTTLVLLDPILICGGPESFAGISFQKAELEQCLKPSVMTSATKITSPLGSNVLLRCDATGYPTPQLTWIRSDNLPVNYRVIQETPREGLRWSIISLTGISYKDAGEYRCKAKNLAGMSEAAVTVTVVGLITTTPSPQRYGRRFGADGWDTPREEAKQEAKKTSSIPKNLSPPASSFSSSSLPLSSSPPSISAKPTPITAETPKMSLRGEKQLELIPSGNHPAPDSATEEEERELPSSATTDGPNVTVKNLKVVSETGERVTLMWRATGTTNSPAVTVFYSRYGEEGMLPLSTDPGKSEITLDGLKPGTQYMACVCPKGASPKKDQCVIFSTDQINEKSGDPVSLLAVASGIACVLVLPLIFFLLYKVFQLQHKPMSWREEDLEKESYIQFETLSVKPRPSGGGGELWTRREPDESQRLLLWSRLSVDSQMTFKSESSGSDYCC